MFTEKLRRRIGAWISSAFPQPENPEIESLRKELGALKAFLQTGSDGNGNGNGHLCVDCPAEAKNEVLNLQLEAEILRNELLDNIAAVHRLEILTLGQRIQLLDDFGKTLPPTSVGRTKRSTKPKGYSFGIITNGQRNDKLEKLIESILRQKIPQHKFEILISGVVNAFQGRDGIRTFAMEDAANEGRLGAMRNVLARSCAFNKFVCLDDDFLLHPSWYEAVEEVDGDFDVATGIILNPDLSRYCDWVYIIENYTSLRPYHETFDNKRQYVTGGYGIYKDFIFSEHSWNDHLGFYQGEDVSFSRRLFDAGYKLKFIPKAVVMHDDERYRQKGYGVIRQRSEEQVQDVSALCLKMEKLCPRSLS